VAHLLALRAVKTLEQLGDYAFLNGELFPEFGDFGGEFGDLLLRRFDEEDTAAGMPDFLEIPDLS
jgi:hypothetical protein